MCWLDMCTQGRVFMLKAAAGDPSCLAAYLVMAQSDPTREIFGHREDVSEEVYLKPIEILVYG